METSILLIKKISISVLLLMFIYPSFLLGQGTSCVDNEPVLQKEVQKIGYCACIITLEYPKVVAYGMKYPVRGQWGQCGAYSNMVSIVKAGWVDDESLESSDFWNISTFDEMFTDFSRSDGAFGVDITVHNDEYSYKHKYLKLQISMIGIGNTTFKNTTIYRIPITNKIFGKVMLIDLGKDLTKEDYTLSPLPSSSDRHIKVFYKSNAADDYKDSMETNTNGCWKISCLPGHTNSFIHFIDNGIKTDPGTVNEITINHPVEGGYIKIFDLAPIIFENRKVRDSLDRKYINIKDALDGTFGLEVYQRVNNYLNEHRKPGTAPLTFEIRIPVKFIDIWGANFWPAKMAELMLSYNHFTKNYDTIYHGENNDSLRAEFLTRLNYAIRGLDTLYEPTQKMAIELSKTLTGLVKVLIFAKEAKAAADALCTDPKSKKDILEAIKFVLNLITNTIDLINNKYNNTICNNGVNNVVGASNNNIAAILSYFEEIIGSETQNTTSLKHFEAVGQLLRDDAIDGAGAVIGTCAVMPYYIARAQDNLNTVSLKLGINANYYEANNSIKLTNSTAYNKVLNTKDPNNIIKQYKDMVDKTVIDSKVTRNKINIITTIFSSYTLLSKYLKGGVQLALWEILKPIQLYGYGILSMADYQTLNDGFNRRYCLPVMSCFPGFTYVNDASIIKADMLYSFHGNNPIKSINNNNNKAFVKKSKGDNIIKTQILKINTMINAAIDEAILAAGNTPVDTNIVNQKSDNLLSLSDSIISLNQRVNYYVCTVADSAVKADTNFYNYYMSVLNDNYINNIKLFYFNDYLMKRKRQSGTSDSLIIAANIARSGLLNYETNMNKLIDSISDIPGKAYIAIQKVEINPDTLLPGKPFKVKAFVTNPGTVVADSLIVRILPDTLTQLNSSKEFFINSLLPNETKEFEWDLIVNKLTKTMTNFNIEVASRTIYYTYYGSEPIKIKPLTEFTCDGNLLYEDNSTGKALSNVKLILKTSEEEKKDSTTTDSKGYYKFSQVKPGAYFVEPEIKKQPGGINPIDALLINRNYLSMYKISNELMKKAADVNLDTKITPIDALMVNRRYLGIVKTFKAGNWIYEKDTVKIINDDIRYNIKAICPGDVNGNYSPPGK